MTHLLTELPGLFVLLGLGLVVYWLLLVAVTAWMITHPPRRTYATAVARGWAGDPGELDPARPFESWMLDSRGRELPVWDIAGDSPEGPIVVCTHGWGDGRLGALVRLPVLLAAASRVLAWDIPGCGEAPRGACRMGSDEHHDLLALLDRIDLAERTQRGVILYGWSLGAGVSIVAAAESPDAVKGVIVEAPFRMPSTPARGMLRLRRLPQRVNLRPAMGVVGALLGIGPGWRSFDRAEHAERLRCPLLVIHGDRDPVSPIADGRQIADAAPAGRLCLVENAGHSDLWTDERFVGSVSDAVGAFIECPA